MNRNNNELAINRKPRIETQNSSYGIKIIINAFNELNNK